MWLYRQNSFFKSVIFLFDLCKCLNLNQTKTHLEVLMLLNTFFVFTAFSFVVFCSCEVQFWLRPLHQNHSTACRCSWRLTLNIQHPCMLMTSCFPASKPSNDSCRFAPLHKPLMRKHYQFVSVDSHSFLLFSVDYYTTKTPTDCFGAGNFTVNSAGMEAAPPPLNALLPSSLSFFILFIYI